MKHFQHITHVWNFPIWGIKSFSSQIASANIPGTLLTKLHTAELSQSLPVWRITNETQLVLINQSKSLSKDLKRRAAVW